MNKGVAKRILVIEETASHWLQPEERLVAAEELIKLHHDNTDIEAMYRLQDIMVLAESNFNRAPVLGAIQELITRAMRIVNNATMMERYANE